MAGSIYEERLKTTNEQIFQIYDRLMSEHHLPILSC
jgi:hypothetical protein